MEEYITYLYMYVIYTYIMYIYNIIYMLIYTSIYMLFSRYVKCQREPVEGTFFSFLHSIKGKTNEIICDEK